MDQANMKKCKKCGALQKDSRSTCIDCGEQLGPPLSKQEEKDIDMEVSKKIRKLSNRGDYFYISKLDRVIAILNLIAAAQFLIINILNRGSLSEADLYISIIAIIVMLICAVDLMFPQISWELYKMKFIFAIDNPEDMEPSVFMLYMRRITGYTVCVIGYIYLIYRIVKVLL
jgi:hypothetical protein